MNLSYVGFSNWFVRQSRQILQEIQNLLQVLSFDLILKGFSCNCQAKLNNLSCFSNSVG